MTTPSNGQRYVPSTQQSQAPAATQTADTQYVTRTSQAPATSTAYEVETQPVDNDHTGQEAWIGTDNENISHGNISWGSIFAGVVTFLSIMTVFGLVAAAMGLQGSTGIATGITTIIGLVIAFAAAGYVAGALGVRAGLFHGFATWATSLLSALILAGWLGASVIGGLGSIAGNTLDTVAQTAGNAAEVTSTDVYNGTDALQDGITQSDIDDAQRQAQDAATQVQDTYNEYSDDAAEGTWWTILGLVLGAVISSLAGAAGARSVLNKKTEKVLARKN